MAIKIKIAAEYDQKGLRNAEKSLKDFGDNAKKALAAVGVATLAVGAGLVKFGSESISAAQNVEQANRRLEQVAKSMNLFGSETAKVSQRLIDFAEKNEVLVGVDGEVIKATQAKLLTFKQLAQTADSVGGSFDRATMAALDLAAAGFGSAETNATQLGKALQDPIKGITALARSGVTFTQVEREKIKALVASGNILEAQNLILSAIETQVGGTAEATAKASDRMKLAFENILESVGAQLLPVFEDFSAEVLKITPELEEGLSVAAEEVAKVLREQVLPAVQGFAEWLASPAGTAAIRDLANALVGLVKGFIDVATFVIANRDALALLGGALGALTLAYKITTTAQMLYAAQLTIQAAATAGATTATGALRLAMLSLPFAAVAAGIASLAIAQALVSEKSRQVKQDLQETGSTVVQTSRGYVKFGADVSNSGRKMVYSVNQTSEAIKAAEDATRKLNSTSLAKYRGQLGDTRVEAGKLAEQQRALYYAMKGQKPPKIEDPFSGTSGGGGGGGGGETKAQKAKREREEAIKEANQALKNAQKQLIQAQTDYNKTTATLAEQNTAAIARIQADFANRLANIAKQSRERLTAAFKSVGAISLTDLFQVDETRSVANLVKGLTDKLKASKDLIANASKLAANGFSQTFIEQVVSAGTTTGNELASAILESTPETQKELQTLFGQVETTANSGMDALAQEIYNKQGLATQELKDLYATTQTELTTALAEQQTAFQKGMADAAAAFVERVTGIRADLKEQLENISGDFSSLNGVIGTFTTSLDTLIETYGKLAGLPPVNLPSINFPSAPDIPSGNDQRFSGKKDDGKTIIYINPKIDPSQSPAQVGQIISKQINKYTGRGGGIRIGQAAV